MSGQHYSRRMYRAKIRGAAVDDAPALGRVLVESWLPAHRGLIPDAAWQKRADEWTPEVSTEAWLRFFAARAEGQASRTVLLVAEDEKHCPVALVMGSSADDASGTLAEISDLFVLPNLRGQGIGSSLLRAAASQLATHGLTSLHVCVLSTNMQARCFYEAMGGQEHGQRFVDEDGLLLPLTVYAWRDIGALASLA